MQPVSRETVNAFYQAFASRSAARIAPFVDDDVEWTISGPVDVLQFCGVHRGKQAVLRLFDRLVPETFQVTGINPEALLVDGDRAAMLCTVTGVKGPPKRTISYRLSQFSRFRDGKIFEFCSIIDSFDAAEQILGHAIDVTQRTSLLDRASAGDLISV